MIKGHPEICLFEPEIPQNAGNIGRLAAAAGCRLHLIKPFGFATDDKNLRRPGLDYWPFLDLEIHDSIEPILHQFSGKLAFFSKKGEKSYSKLPSSTKLLVFGRETSGLPDSLHERYADHFYKIPIFHPGVRSLNLANAASIIVYHCLEKYYDK